MRAPLRYAGAKQAKFPYFSKGKLVSAWLISKSSGIFLYKSSFCASNSWPAFCFVLVFVTNHAMPTFYVIRPELLRKKCLLRLKYGYLSHKNAWIRYRRPLFTTRSRVKHVLLRMRALYSRLLDCWQKARLPPL